MNKKLMLIAVAAILLTAPTIFAQDALTQLSTDLQTVFDELGKEMVPNLQTVSVLNHGLGSAQIGNLPHMYVSLSVGTSVAPGILKFTGDEEKFVNYSLLNNFLEEASLNDDSIRDITDNYAPYPAARASFGMGLFGDWEFDIQAGVAPQSIADMAGVDGLTANITTVGGRIRKVLVRQERGVPAVSVGIGYVYSGINLGYDLEEIEPLDTGGGTELDLKGELTYQATTHSYGTDVRVSTRFLRVFYPFIGASGYFQTSSYTAGIDDFSADIVNTNVTPNTRTAATPSTEPLSEQDFQNFNLVINSGIDMKLLIFNFFTHLNYAVTTQAPGAVVGFRLQI